MIIIYIILGGIFEDTYKSNNSTDDANNTDKINEEEIIDIKDDKNFIWIDPQAGLHNISSRN